MINLSKSAFNFIQLLLQYIQRYYSSTKGAIAVPKLKKDVHILSEPAINENHEKRLTSTNRQNIIHHLLTDELQFTSVEEIKEAIFNRYNEVVPSSTLARDLRFISAQKVNGFYAIVEPNKEKAKVTRSKQMLDLQAIYIHSDIDFFAIKTYRGQGAGVAEALETIFGNRIKGTIVGDNSVLVLVPRHDKQALCEEIAELGNLEIKNDE